MNIFALCNPRAAGLKSLAAMLLAGAALADECRVPGLPPAAAFQASADALPSRDLLDLGRRALAAGRNREAAHFLERAAAMSGPAVGPGEPAVASAMLALAYARMGERERSLAAAGTALAARDLPAHAHYEVRASIAPVYARFHGRAAARQHAADAAEAAQSPRHRGLALGNLARLESDPAAASGAAHRALELLPASGAARIEQVARLAALEVLALHGPASDRGRVEAGLASAYEEADRAGDAALAADALGVLAMVRTRAADRDSALAAADRAVALAGAADSPRLHDWLWLRAQLRSRAGRTAEAMDDYASAAERLRRVRTEVETELADFGLVFRERYFVLYIEFADLLLARAEREAVTGARQSLLVRARDAVETAKVAEVADYFRDPCIARDAVRSRLEAVDRTSAVLYYIALKDRVVALVSHRDGIEQIRLGATEAEIGAMVDEFRRFLEKRSTRQYLRPAQKLHAALLKPLEAALAALAPTTLVVVPDGVLRTVPFAAMHDGKQFVAQRYAVAVAPSLSLTDPRPLAAVRPEALVNGLTLARQGFSSLPSVHDEVAALDGILSARVILNEAFLTQRVLDEVERSPAGIVHIASHGQFSTNFEDTFILTYDGKLGIDALRNAIAAGRTRPEPIEILTLSACQTAAGDERAALGLAGVAVRAGARSALASLWFVNDESTAMLVTEFYRNAVTRRMPRAQALRQAQIAMMADERFNHPAYWGAFLLIGSWL